MSTPAFHVRPDGKPAACAAFIKRAGARSYSGHFTDTGMVYLLKSADRRGAATIARVIVPSEADAVFQKAWSISQGIPLEGGAA
jgi:hypothetical protein